MDGYTGFFPSIRADDFPFFLWINTYVVFILLHNTASYRCFSSLSELIWGCFIMKSVGVREREKERERKREKGGGHEVCVCMCVSEKERERE